MGRAMKRGIDALPEHYRVPLVLREFSGLCYQEIADRLELDMGTVKSRLARGRAQLVKFLLADGNISPPATSKTAKTSGKTATKRKGGSRDADM